MKQHRSCMRETFFINKVSFLCFPWVMLNSLCSAGSVVCKAVHGVPFSFCSIYFAPSAQRFSIVMCALWNSMRTKDIPFPQTFILSLLDPVKPFRLPYNIQTNIKDHWSSIKSVRHIKLFEFINISDFLPLCASSHQVCTALWEPCKSLPALLFSRFAMWTLHCHGLWG